MIGKKIERQKAKEMPLDSGFLLLLLLSPVKPDTISPHNPPSLFHQCFHSHSEIMSLALIKSPEEVLFLLTPSSGKLPVTQNWLSNGSHN